MRLLEFENIDGDLVNINPEFVSFVQPDIGKDNRHVCLLSVQGAFPIQVFGNRIEIVQKLTREEN